MNETEIRFREYCFKMHGGQKYYHDLSYSLHLNLVADMAKQFNLDESQILSAYGHDLFEHTGATTDGIVEAIGDATLYQKVITNLYDLTDGSGVNRRERQSALYPVLRENKSALAVKLCDRLVNINFSVISFNARKLAMYASETKFFVDSLYSQDDLRLRELWGYFFEVSSSIV